MSADVIVVGAGVVGAATALALAESGHQVSVVEAAAQVAAGTSGANGAQLSYNYTDAMASPDTLRTLPKLLLGKDPAFRLTPRLDPDFLAWGLRFLRECAASRSDANTLAVLEIALRSCTRMNLWRERYAFDFDHAAAQKMHLYEDAAALQAARRRVELKNRFGARQSVISAADALALEPTLAQMHATLVGAIHSPGDAVGDAAKFARAAIDHALHIGGGQLHLDTRALDLVLDGQRCTALRTSAGELRCDILVLCAGPDSLAFANGLGVTLPIVPVAGYSLTFPAVAYTPRISLTDVSNKIVMCRVGERMRVAGMADIGRRTREPPPNRIDTLRAIVRRRFPQAADYQGDGSPWAGMRPMTPDSRPIVTRWRDSNLFLNMGHGMLGWTLAAGTAEMLALKVSAFRQAGG